MKNKIRTNMDSLLLILTVNMTLLNDDSNA